MTTQQKTILIVEDEEAVREALVDTFTREGFDVLSAKNGKEGLDSALSKHPDLILLDIVMPIMDGITMAKQLRQDEWGKHVPIILLTNLSDVEHVASAVENDMYDFLVKTDWTLDSVVTTVKERLGI